MESRVCAGNGKNFYPRPPRGGRLSKSRLATASFYFYPRPPRGGRLRTVRTSAATSDFYPRPPRGGRLALGTLEGVHGRISIHALREEGDTTPEHCPNLKRVFLSTPSARRATSSQSSSVSSILYFYPRPPRGGRRQRKKQSRKHEKISIHALREEGDLR